MESVAFIQWCLDHLNYWTITLLMAIESSFIPFPSEVVVPPAAYKAASGSSDLNVYLVVLFATLGANIGALINYYLAYFVGRPIVYKFANSRFGHMCLIDEAKDAIMNTFMDKVKILFENCLAWLVPMAFLMTVVCFFLAVLIVKRKGRGVR